MSKHDLIPARGFRQPPLYTDPARSAAVPKYRRMQPKSAVKSCAAISAYWDTRLPRRPSDCLFHRLINVPAIAKRAGLQFGHHFSTSFFLYTGQYTILTAPPCLQSCTHDAHNGLILSFILFPPRPCLYSSTTYPFPFNFLKYSAGADSRWIVPSTSTIVACGNIALQREQ